MPFVSLSYNCHTKRNTVLQNEKREVRTKLAHKIKQLQIL